MAKIVYRTNYFLREYVIEDERILRAVFLERKALEPGMIFLGRVESWHNHLKGFFVNLGETKGIYQGSEELRIGRHYLFEVRKISKGKYPVLSRNISLIGEHVVYREKGETEVSSALSEYKSKELLTFNKPVYFKRTAEDVPLHQLQEEVLTLETEFDRILSFERGERKIRHLYSPPHSENFDDMAQIVEWEEEILRLRQPMQYSDDIQYFVEPTRVGLVIDVNSAGFQGETGKINDYAMEFVSELMLRMNVGGLVLVDLIGQGELSEFHDLMKRDSRITSVSISKNGILEIIRRSDGINMYDVDPLKIMADFIKLRLEAMELSRLPQKIQVSKRFRGLEEYLDLAIEYGEVFGWFKILE